MYANWMHGASVMQGERKRIKNEAGASLPDTHSNFRIANLHDSNL